MMKRYDGHNDGRCTDCRNSLSQRDCDAMCLGHYDRALDSIARGSFGRARLVYLRR
ncbi:hypothetical protein MYCOZU2_04924 [Mycobacterium intracellulare subsp. chimaera]|uniref:Uncharacterized protein n=1 Tax=Mycobacterium intracellulare subsp. chimaera TaxID=222805 RepID=A0A7U5MPR1_MYCIT|nr:hypothetical protein MYCOZU2_04924 [Mycobacterium intracellulare subsp. chimaera]BCO85918.1 hypothetical protein MINTM011_42530 [Mycobacterium paraintracellulare]